MIGPIQAIQGTVWDDGVAMSPVQARNRAARLIVAAEQADEQNAASVGVITRAGEALAHRESEVERARR